MAYNRVEYDATFKRILLEGKGFAAIDQSTAEVIEEELQRAVPWIDDVWVASDYPNEVVVRLDTTPEFSKKSLETRSSEFLSVIDRTLKHLGQSREKVAVCFSTIKLRNLPLAHY